MRFSLLTVQLILLCLFSSILSQTYKIYYLKDPYIRKYNGVGRDSKGNVYFGAGNVWEPNAALFRYDPLKDSIVMLGTVDTASLSVNNWLQFDTPGKIHTDIYEWPDGRIFFATHSKEERDNTFAYFRGGHVYSYNPQTGGIKDESIASVAIPNQGVIGMVPAPSVNALYCIGYPAGDIYKFNVSTGKSNFLFNCGYKSGAISRCILSDNQGRIYYPNGVRFLCYDPDTGLVKPYPGKGLNGITQIAAHVSSLSGDTIYFISRPGYHVWQYLPVPDTAIDLGPANMNGESAEVANLALRWDLNKLYYAPNDLGKLVEFDLATGLKHKVMDIPVDDFTGSNGVDKDGNIWVSSYAEANPVYKFILNIPCPVCSTSITDIDNKKTASILDPVLEISPNPVTSDAHIILSAPNPRLFKVAQIIDVKGRVVSDLSQHLSESQTANGYAINWLTNRFRPGVYFVRFSGTGKNLIGKIVVIR